MTDIEILQKMQRDIFEFMASDEFLQYPKEQQDKIDDLLASFIVSHELLINRAKQRQKTGQVFVMSLN